MLAVGVLVIDWITIGCSPPINTHPTFTVSVFPDNYDSGLWNKKYTHKVYIRRHKTRLENIRRISYNQNRTKKYIL